MAVTKAQRADEDMHGWIHAGHEDSHKVENSPVPPGTTAFIQHDHV